MAATGKAPEIQNSDSINGSADSTVEPVMPDSKAADLDKEERLKTEMQDVEKGKETKVSSSNLGGHQPPYQAEIIEFRHRQNSLNHRVQITEEKGRADDQLPGKQELIPVPAEKMKNGVKVACLVIAVSTTAIVSFLSDAPKAYSSFTSKFLLKSGILAMFASLFSALGLLMLSTEMLPTKNAKLSCSNRSLSIIIWASTGLMTLALVLFMAFFLI